MNHPIFFTGYMYAFAAGFFGASFFMIVELQLNLARSNQSDLRELWTFRMIALRCLFGIGAATILYFLFQTQLLDSPVWPDVEKINFGAITKLIQDESALIFTRIEYRLPNHNTALLIVWSFLAGYSQKLVPNLLTKTGESSTAES